MKTISKPPSRRCILAPSPQVQSCLVTILASTPNKKTGCTHLGIRLSDTLHRASRNCSTRFFPPSPQLHQLEFARTCRATSVPALVTEARSRTSSRMGSAKDYRIMLDYTDRSSDKIFPSFVLYITFPLSFAFQRAELTAVVCEYCSEKERGRRRKTNRSDSSLSL